MTLNNYSSEASIMVARQLKIVSQSDAFTISVARNIQYVLKKLVCLIVFVKDIFGTYLNIIYHIVFGGRTGLVVRASDSGSGDPGSILGRVGVLFP